MMTRVSSHAVLLTVSVKRRTAHMSLLRNYPFDATPPATMRNALERLLEENFSPIWGKELFAIGHGFPIDVFEDEKNYVIEASMPGIKPEDLKVSATGNAITIRATAAYDEKRETEAKPREKTTRGYLRRERYVGEVTRVIDLPTPISPDAIKATYKHGVLTLEVPKAEESRAKHIEVVVKE